MRDSCILLEVFFDKRFQYSVRSILDERFQYSVRSIFR